jgi:hypothetical protein
MQTQNERVDDRHFNAGPSLSQADVFKYISEASHNIASVPLTDRTILSYSKAVRLQASVAPTAQRVAMQP